MNRSQTSSRIGETQTRYIARIESPPCMANPSQEGRIAIFNLLRTMIDTPDLLACGPAMFQEASIVHDGEKWVITLEAVVDEAPRAPW